MRPSLVESDEKLGNRGVEGWALDDDQKSIEGPRSSEAGLSGGKVTLDIRNDSGVPSVRCMALVIKCIFLSLDCSGFLVLRWTGR